MSLYPTLQHAPHPSQLQTQQNDILYAGWLQKKGDKGVVLLWKKRYFIVDKKSIRYFSDQTQQDLKGSITWESISGIEFTNNTLWNDCRYFQIETNTKRVYYLFTEDQVVSLDWVSNLQKILNFYKQSVVLLGNNSSNNNENNTSSNVYDSLDNNYNNNVNNFDKAAAAASPSPPTNSFDNSNNSNNNNNNNNNSLTNNYGFEEQFSNNNNNNRQYKDFLNYSQPYYNHFYDNIGKPIQPQNDSLLNIPPRPPGPLRELNQELVKDILPMEGKDLEFYYQSTVHFSNLLLTSGSDYVLLSCYLILSILDWDNKKAQPLPYACTPPYESDIVFPYFTYSIQLIRNEILNKWPQQGPTYCTQIDLFSKKKRKNFPLLLENEDRETFLQRNLLLLNYVLKSLVNGNRMATIEDSICVLIDRFLEDYESLPTFKYGNFLWKEIEQGGGSSNGVSTGDQQHQQHYQSGEISSKDKLTIKNILLAYLLFQKLNLEKKNNAKLQFDSITSQRYESVGHKFSQLLHQYPLLTPYQGHIQRTIVRIFFLWQKDLPLCESTSTYDVSIYRNYKVFSRMLHRTGQAFPQLYSAIKEVRDSLFKTIESKMGSFDINNIDSTSLDSIIN